ncbi:hypothetical protein BT69DRAFT_53407 [Atractiella rhizophila]|nr:hypothetical protein BT69DRAFT_53407 [Atractiella rhizophila]
MDQAQGVMSFHLCQLHLPLPPILFTMHLEIFPFLPLPDCLVHSSLAHTSATDYIILRVWEGHMSKSGRWKVATAKEDVEGSGAEGCRSRLKQERDTKPARAKETGQREDAIEWRGVLHDSSEREGGKDGGGRAEDVKHSGVR